MSLKKRILKSSVKLQIGFVILILVVLFLLFVSCRFLVYIYTIGQPITRYEYHSDQYICIEEVFEKYRLRWNEECKNLPDTLKVNPNPRDMDNGFACGLPSSIAIELDKSKELLEEECTKLEK
jgi:hypothetical protein